MPTISHASAALIREMALAGFSTARIARRLGHGENTVRKYRSGGRKSVGQAVILSPLARLALVRDVTLGLPADSAALRYGLASRHSVYVIVHRERKRLRGEVARREPRVWTEAPVARLAELWTGSTLGNADIAEDINVRFGLSLTDNAVRHHARALGLKRHPDALKGCPLGAVRKETSAITLPGGCVYRGGQVERIAA